MLSSLFAVALVPTFPAQALPTDTPAHQFTEQHWGVAEGLPQVSGRAMLQSRSGALWIGTQDGLARFDGLEFEVFDSDRYPGLVHTYINDLHEDGAGRIWIATEQGLCVYDAGTIRAVETPGEPLGSVRALATGPEPDQLWLATENGLFLVGPTGAERHRRIRSPLFSLARADAGQLFAGGRGSIWSLDDDTVVEFEFPASDADQEVKDLLIHEGHLIQGLSGGLHKAPLDEPSRWSGKLLSGREIEALVVDDGGSLWVASVSGLYRQRPQDPEPVPVRTQTFSESDWIDELFEDRAGNLWIGARARGIVRLSPGSFRRFGAMDGLVDDIVWSFYEDPAGGIWAGTNEYGAYRMSDGVFEQVAPPELLPHAMTLGFLLDSQDRFWIATGSGVAWFSWPELEPLTAPPELPDHRVSGIAEDRHGRVWLATRSGLYWWRDGELRRIDERRGLTQSRTRDVLEDSQGDIWVATDAGLFRGNAEAMTPMGVDAGLRDYTAWALFEFDGTVWALLQGAMVRFVDGQARIYPDGQGLSATLTLYMAMDREGYIWSNTHEGIQRIHRSQFDEFDRRERERFDPEFFGQLSSPVAAQCNGGHGQAGLFQPDIEALWCPSLEGALRLDLARARDKPLPPRPRLRQMRSGGESISLEFAERASQVLPPSARDLEVDFSGLHFRHPQGVEYRFQLKGFDSQWHEAGHRRTAFYTNLPPGDYRFTLLARNEYGIESEDPAVLELHLTPHFHQTGWFRTLMLVVLLLLAYGVWRFSVRRLRRQKMLLERLVRKRTDQLRQASLTDPLTGLRNRRYLKDQIPHDIAQVNRIYRRDGDRSNRDIAFLMLDLDHFKQINDVYGHHAGDQVLSQFADILRSQCRASDYVVRMGGEEFLVVARDTQRSEAEVSAERIMRSVRDYQFMTDHGTLECKCSIGLTCYPALTEQPDALDWEAILELADAANYVAKTEGRDRWVKIELTSQADPQDFMQRFRREGTLALARAGELSIGREKPQKTGESGSESRQP